MEDQVPQDVVKERFDRLLKEVQRIAAKRAEALTGRTEQVLVEEVANFVCQGKILFLIILTVHFL